MNIIYIIIALYFIVLIMYSMAPEPVVVTNV